MNHQGGLLSEVSHWYPIIGAIAALGQVKGPLFITYDDMLARGVSPDVQLYKIIANAAERNSTAAYMAVFDWWRLLNSRVVPDVELMNSLIRCCDVCGEGERGFMFFGLFEQCELTPDLDTFDALFKVTCVHNTQYEHKVVDSLLQLCCVCTWLSRGFCLLCTVCHEHLSYMYVYIHPSFI